MEARDPIRSLHHTCQHPCFAFKEEADASWRDYQETGLHLTGEEVLDWRETWGTDHETPALACHT